MKNAKINNLLKFVKLFIILIAAYLAFACVACLMPDKPVQKHIYQSVHRGDLQEDYPRAVLPKKQCQMDNYTDALILNQAYRCSKDSLAASMLEVWRATGPYASVDVLRNETEGAVESVDSYSRYWHGSTFFIRILLLFSDYTSIRMQLMLMSVLLLIWAASSFAKSTNRMMAVLLILSLLIMNAHVMMFSIQFFPMLALSLVGVILVCRNQTNYNAMLLSFFVIGSLTAFFDLLTVPLTALGIPLCCLIAIWANNTKFEWKSQIFHIFRIGITWVLGYASTWASKWLIAGTLTDCNTINDAIEQTAKRSSELTDYTRWDAVMQNLDFMPWKYLFVIVGIMAIMMFVRGRSGKWRSSILLLAMALMPICWFLFAANHSYEHWWFTYRELMTTTTAILFAVGLLVNPTKETKSI